MYRRAKLDIPQKFRDIQIAYRIPETFIALYLPYKRTVGLLHRKTGHTLRVKMPKCKMQHTVCNHIRPLLRGKIHIFIQKNRAIRIYTGIAVLAEQVPVTDMDAAVHRAKKRMLAKITPARLQALLIFVRLFLLLFSHVCPPQAAAGRARSPA